MPIVIYAIGSPIVADVEETCRRLRADIVGWVRNVPGESFAPDGVQISDADRLPADLLQHDFLVPLFTSRYRISAVGEARQRGFVRPATLIDPTAVVASTAAIGPGTYVNSMVNIGAACRIGAFCFVNRGATIGHHSELDEFASVGPAATIAGMVRVGKGAMIGAGAVVLPRVTIGANAVVAAGAVVTKPVAPDTTVAGNPARLFQGPSTGEMHTG
ncbi:DapH/DapD/GlmU-related protein [Rhodoplanes sp. Z2-YC6860]|uniref:DapH/DapD/GlmU-related protein n=1 Tax=Rhodoplanes sp. Z2-YC6860 TaxID=674703 RepID=UPI00078DD5CD|nr:DapH/DapD/GlmU-related protein [Rhodoplanes sp. Z2-YC6860]AMN43209.1 acetyltransferase [Rhodoplanes sp. Z2-YC6860]